MLTVITGNAEGFNDELQTFVYSPVIEFEVEHSLVSLSKWEQKYKVSFLESEKTMEQMLDYYHMMVLTPGITIDVIQRMGQREHELIQSYINSTETATKFYDVGAPKPGKQETITAELIYYWMTVAKIPWEAEKWHLNRLLTLIRLANLKQTPAKKRSPQEIAAWQREENARRLKELGTTG